MLSLQRPETGGNISFLMPAWIRFYVLYPLNRKIHILYVLRLLQTELIL